MRVQYGCNDGRSFIDWQFHWKCVCSKAIVRAQVSFGSRAVARTGSLWFGSVRNGSDRFVSARLGSDRMGLNGFGCGQSKDDDYELSCCDCERDEPAHAPLVSGQRANVAMRGAQRSPGHKQASDRPPPLDRHSDRSLGLDAIY